MPKPPLIIPIKVQRMLARKAAKASKQLQTAHPIYFLRKTLLSPLYNEQSSDSYLEQVFESVRKIGQGSFGDVFEARLKANSKMYAIKITNHAHTFIDIGEVRRYEKIGDHNNCVKFYQAWQQSHQLYIQMELCLTSLDKIVMINRHIKESQCWNILTDIAKALKHLHDHDLIHMDIKPPNIMISSEGICKLGDFGLMIDLRDIDPKTKKRKRTGLSVSEGDGRYIATEVLCNATYTTAGDVFSFGLMMLEVASSTTLPSSGVEWDAIRAGVLPECYYRRELSHRFRKLTESMIVKDYAQRPSVDEVLNYACNNKTEYMNIVDNWEFMWRNYVSNSMEQENNGLQALPEASHVQPSTMYYIPSRDSYSTAKKNCPYLDDDNNNLSVPEEKRYNRIKKISRKLIL